MLVYGDSRRIESTERLVDALRNRLKARPRGDSSELRDWSTHLLIEAGELVQGIFDAVRARHQLVLRPPDLVLRDLALAAARAHLATEPELYRPREELSSAARAVECALDRLIWLDVPSQVQIHVPEGYAYYAVYPVLYALAAQQAARVARPWVVLGILSIGASLGAVVAAVLGTDQLYFVRPVGPVFCREVSFDAHLQQALATHGENAHYAIVDEGPGLSGSTFGAVADWLEHHGIDADRIHFFPSHAVDLGPRASEAHRARWECARRCHRPFESYFDDARLRRVVFDGKEGELLDVSAGRWRSERFRDRAAWPPVHPGFERRKYLLCSSDGMRIAKFVGLGRYGQAAVRRAFLLHGHGFVPEPLDHRDGFLVSRWHENAVPLEEAPIARGDWLSHVAQYLAFVADECRAESAGASPEELLNMTCVNVGEALGEKEATRVRERWSGRLREIAAACTPVAIDARMHAWEWLALPDGRLLKADALEHHADHGLVGCQDLAWDVAGLRIEHALTAPECEQLVIELASRTPYRPHREKETFLTWCYSAYQLGYYALAAEAAATSDPDEARRSARWRDVYASHLRRLLTTSL
jgi:hypothetical protein